GFAVFLAVAPAALFGFELMGKLSPLSVQCRAISSYRSGRGFAELREYILLRSVGIHPPASGNARKLTSVPKAVRRRTRMELDHSGDVGLMPMRNSMRCPSGMSALRVAMPCCTSIAQRTALTGLANS